MDLVERKEAAPAIGLRRWSHPLAIGLAVLFAAVFLYLMWYQVVDDSFQRNWLADQTIYRGAAERWLAGGPWYLPAQTTGQPYTAIVGDVMYPPVAMPWLVPTVFLPGPLFIVVPLAIVAAVVVYHRPSPWGWAGVLFCLAWPQTGTLILSANPALWMMAACAVGTIWRPGFAFIWTMPSLFPFALLGLRSRGWWLLSAAIAGLGLLVLPFSLEWLGVVWNARGGFSGILYSNRDIAMMCLPLVAWATSGRSSRGLGLSTWWRRPSVPAWERRPGDTP